MAAEEATTKSDPPSDQVSQVYLPGGNVGAAIQSHHVEERDRERVVSHRMKLIHFSWDCSSSSVLPTSFESAGVEACTLEEAVSEASNSPAAEPPAPMAVVTAAANAGAVLSDIDDHILPSMSHHSTNFLTKPV